MKYSQEDKLVKLYNSFYKIRKVEEEISIPDDKGMIAWPLILFSIGINIFVFGIFLLLFSKGGEVILKYNSNFWFLYVIAASPLLYLGIKGILIRK